MGEGWGASLKGHKGPLLMLTDEEKQEREKIELKVQEEVKKHQEQLNSITIKPEDICTEKDKEGIIL